MGKIILGMAVSLDGYSNDRDGDLGLLYPDMEAMHNSAALQAAIAATGAVVMGRRTFDMSADPDWYAGNYEFQTPIFVLTHHLPAKHPKETDQLKFTFVTDGVVSALTQARAAAGDKDVNIIGGADTAQQCLRSGLVDELQVTIIPILLGGGLRPLDNIADTPIHLERLGVDDWPGGGTNLRFRVVK